MMTTSIIFTKFFANQYAVIENPVCDSLEKTNRSSPKTYINEAAEIIAKRISGD